MKSEADEVRLVIVIECAERLKETLPELLVPLTRLTELTQLDLSVILLSEVRWEAIRPPLGASPDPYFIDLPPLSKEVIVQRLIFNFTPSNDLSAGPYHASLKGLYSHFATVLCDVCYPFVHDPLEIEYIAAARWPGFVQPVLDEHRRFLADEMDLDDPEQAQLEPPAEVVRMRLSRLFNASLSAALEELYPRLTNATDWAAKNKPEPDLLSAQPAEIPRGKDQPGKSSEAAALALPRMSRFILVATFLASTNPGKSDIRMFGRGLDEKKRRRRVRKTTKSGPTKVPQRLLGPVAFPLDRLLAILGALLEENDVETRLLAPEFKIPGEYTDMETSRVAVYSAVMELTSMRLIHRTTPGDRIDGPPSFKCGISYDVALALAKELSIPLNDLMWDPA
ncbi:Origin recognition complex subunit 5 [Termitomyces sp. J132]|nr:Origin recognition complex subunit 5 [Termitomyces sp. J132]